MPFPGPGTAVPPLPTYGVSFNGLALGPGTPYMIQKFEGLDRPNVRSSDPDWPRFAGQSIGLDLLAGRDINLTLEISADNGITLPEATQSLRNALAPRGTTEDPLYVCIAGNTYVGYFRIRKHNVPIDVSYALGGLAKNVVVNMHATDPNFYATPTQSPICSLAAPSGGFQFPFTFPLSFGGGTTGNTVEITNSGDVECYPVLVIAGPVTYPAVTNLTIAETLTFNLVLAVGDLLIVQLGTPHSATYYASGSYPNNGVSRLYTLSTSSTWWYLPSGVGPNAVNNGTSTIKFTSQDTSFVAGTCTIWNTSAYSSLT